MGEARRKALAARQVAGQEPAEPQVVDTLGGRMHVRWDEGAAATPHGQLVFFAEFLAATGVFERWVSSCPLEYRSGNAPDKRDVLGTLMLGLLAGHRRYAHITALRGDTVAAQALGMAKVISEDALRRALERIDETASAAWLRPSLATSVREALDRPWVLDIDASIKPLYGRQEGAEIGYNPSKPMRPSHVLHTFLVSHLRLVLDVQVNSGKQHTSGHAKAALGRLLDELGDKRPALVRGDSGYGNEGILLTLEEHEQPYLLRLRQTKNVQAVQPPGLEPFAATSRASGVSTASNCGCEGQIGSDRLCCGERLRRTTQDINRCQTVARTTGGAGPRIRREGWRPSPAARCCLPRPPATPTRPRVPDATAWRSQGPGRCAC
jgi:hypothetical protein